MEECGESGGDFIEAREYPSVVFQESESALAFVTFFVKFCVVFAVHDSVAFWWNHCNCSLRLNMRDDGVGVVAFIGEQCLKFQPFDQRNRLAAVGFLAAGEYKSEWVSEGIAHAVNFGTEASA